MLIGDHPRSRGVYTVFRLIFEIIKGSSPLARGLHPLLSRTERLDRIIPARAGFTLNAIRNNASAEDHPRSRGVY